MLEITLAGWVIYYIYENNVSVMIGTCPTKQFTLRLESVIDLLVLLQNETRKPCNSFPYGLRLDLFWRYDFAQLVVSAKLTSLLVPVWKGFADSYLFLL